MEFSRISLNCERMQSFQEVVDHLHGKFTPKDRVILRIAYSKLEDLVHRSFQELNMTIEDLKLNHNNLVQLSPYTFAGLTHVTYLSIADNPLPYMPVKVLEQMPNIGTLDLGRMRLQDLPEESFKSLPYLHTLILPGNNLNQIDNQSIPSSVAKLHLARDSIHDLNGTLRHLNDLQWLFLNLNDLTTLENQLPLDGLKIKMIHASFNRIERLPQELRLFPNLDNLFFQNNLLNGLDRALSKSRKLERAQLENNRISILLEDDFAETESMASLDLGHNLISSLNNSLLPLRKLRLLNLTSNLLQEFSWEEIKGLHDLRVLDLSFNKISHLIGFTPNLVEWETKLTFLRLDHNNLHSLNGALSGLRSLLRLNLSFNSLNRISPDDLIGLDQLTMLDISHNQLTTLEETSKTFLPALEELIASHNYLTILDKDFHGLPVLCWADLSNNQIIALGRDLVSKTHCKIHDGVHEDSWGILKIYLKENPILCDAALPEIIAAMEVNHTKLAGGSHCAPLSEQPVTSKPNAFLGYVPDSLTQSSVLISPPIPVQAQPHVYQQILSPVAPNQPQVHQQLLIGTAQPQVELKIAEQIVSNEMPQNDDANSHMDDHKEQQTHLNEDVVDVIEEVETNHHLLQEPLNQRKHNIQPITNNEPDQDSDLYKRANVHVPEPPRMVFHNDEPTTILQEQQISQMSSEIEQLRTRVLQLTSENERLAQNLTQHIILTNENDNADNHVIADDTRPIEPIEYAMPTLVSMRNLDALDEYEDTRKP